MDKSKNRLKEAIENKEFVVTCELIPGRGASEPAQEEELEMVSEIWESGIAHAISITDNPGGNPALLADKIGDEFFQKDTTPLVHFTLKDRNRNQIQSQLYALERAGVSNLLVMSGDYPVGGWKGRARPVCDLDPVQTLLMIKDMNAGLIQQTPRGEYQEKACNFFAGAVVNPFKYTEGEAITQYAKLDKKLYAGANYLITQLGYDFRKYDELKRYIASTGYDTPIITNVFVLTLGAARLMRQGLIAGCYISDEFFEILQEEAKAEDKGKAARYERAAQMVAISKGMGFAGVHIGGMGLTSESVKGILTRAEELKDQWQDLVPNNCYGDPNGYFYYDAPAADGEFALNADTLAPRPTLVRNGKIMRGYGLSRLFHNLVLHKNKNFYGILKGVMDWREKRKGVHRSHAIEHTAKVVLYGCLDCGDCGLETAIYSCPMTSCPKSQRNGPCGGSKDGYCEVYPGERYCIWFIAYNRLKKFDELYKLTSYITPPNNWDYFETSGWSNYTHDRDNVVGRIMLDEKK